MARYWSINTAATAVPLSVHPSPLSITNNEISGGHIGRAVVRRRCSAGLVLPLWLQVGALKILREMCTSKRVCVTMKQFGGIMSLIDLLQDTDRQVQGLAAEVLSLLSRLSAARRMMRVYGGIKRLVSIPDIM